MSRTIRRFRPGLNPNKPWKVDSRPSGRPSSGSKGEAPSWWVRLFDNIPVRRRHAALCFQIKQGTLDPDAAPMGRIERRPHRFFW